MNKVLVVLKLQTFALHSLVTGHHVSTSPRTSTASFGINLVQIIHSSLQTTHDVSSAFFLNGGHNVLHGLFGHNNPVPSS